MSIEQVARDMVLNIANVDKLKSFFTKDAMASGGVLPMPVPLSESLKVTAGLAVAFPDLKMEIQQVAVKGDQATVTVMWGGTNTGPLNLPVPGMPAIPPTGKKVSVKDIYILTVQGDKVSHFEIATPAGGGIPGAVAQLGVKMPGM
jgi:predicted ester cyclase